MALYMKIPKDMNNIKDTVVWKLTKRQLVFSVVGLTLGIGAYWLTYKAIGTSSAAVLLFFIASPLVFAGMYEKNGFTLEKIAANLIRYSIFPKIRPYQTENVYRKITEAIEYEEEVEMVETGRKKVKKT